MKVSENGSKSCCSPEMIAVSMGPTPEQSNAAYLLTLPSAERNRIMEQAAEAAAPEYEADLALPVAERELTAFTALDGEPFLDEGEP